MRRNILAAVFMIVSISLSGNWASADQASQHPKAVKESKNTASVQTSHLKAVKVSKNSANVLLANKVPVRGLQFTVTGVKVSEIRTTKRTKGFLAKFNDKNGTVLVVSASAASIEPGMGSVLEIVCDKPEAVIITNEKIVAVQKQK